MADAKALRDVIHAGINFEKTATAAGFGPGSLVNQILHGRNRDQFGC